MAAKVNGNNKGADNGMTNIDLQNLMSMAMQAAASMNNNSSCDQDAAELTDDDEVPNVL